MRCVLVSHTHWDREWYRTFQSFRSRLVDTVDRVLDLITLDPGYCFLLDGQTIVLEDYLEVRPSRRAELERAIADARLAIGPWYVQPDSLLPAGETHVRNLLEGRRVGEAFGPVSRVAYTPDSFGHPAQFPQLLRGMGLDGFVYWRGNAAEIERLGAAYRWLAPDGTAMLACHLSYGYFSAAGLGEDAEAAAEKLEALGQRLERFAPADLVLFMNGSDHRLPDAATGAAAEALAKRTGWTVERGLLDAYTDALPREGLPEFTGELVGGRLANLLPGVWSTRTYLKLANRACENALSGWTEPWVALGLRLGAPDERPSLREGWRWLLPNQAHDSICGCSQDKVHEQMGYRYDAAHELAEETTQRVLERLAGLGVERTTPWQESPELAVFNPSPWPRSDVVRFPIDPWPGMLSGVTETPGVHPLLLGSLKGVGYTADGQALRLVPSERAGRVQPLEEHPVHDLEWVVSDVPAFGWKRVRLERTQQAVPDAVDDGSEISTGDVAVRAADDGTLEVRFGQQIYRGLAALEDTGDRGDTYDYDPVTGGRVHEAACLRERRRHPSGIQELVLRRTLVVPGALSEDREARAAETVELPVTLRARVYPGVRRVDLDVELVNQAEDHRLRLLFPTGAPVERFHAASTFDVAERGVGRADDSRWRHPAPDTFIHQGFVAANGLTVAAPGLPEAEVAADGTIAITLLRAVGWLSRGTLRTRPQAAGPPVPTPGAQCAGLLHARLSLHPGLAVREALDAERGLCAVSAGDAPLLAPGHALLSLEPAGLLLSALKPADDGDGSVLRVLNPTDRALEAVVRLGLPVAGAEAVQLDETPCPGDVSLRGDVLGFAVPPRALRSVLLR